MKTVHEALLLLDAALTKLRADVRMYKGGLRDELELDAGLVSDSIDGLLDLANAKRCALCANITHVRDGGRLAEGDWECDNCAEAREIIDAQRAQDSRDL